MTSVTVQELEQYLVAHPGTAAVRAMRQSLIQHGMPPGQAPPHVAGSVRPPAGADPKEHLIDEMRRVCAKSSHSLATVSARLARLLASYFGVAATADGTVSVAGVEAALGAERVPVFELLVHSIEASRAGASIDTLARACVTRRRAEVNLGPNAVGTARPSPEVISIRVKPEVFQYRVKSSLRPVDARAVNRLHRATALRIDGRSPVRRIAEVMSEPRQQVNPPAAFEAIVKRAAARQVFRGVKLVVRQHLYPSTQALLDGCVKAGVRPEDVLVFGKPYSGTARTAAAVLQGGMKLVVPSLTQTELIDHEDYSRALIGEQLSSLLSQTGDALVLVLDDGGQIARVAATAPRITAHLPRFRFVEQTQRGVNELEALKIQTPYVPVGRLWLKKRYESPSVVRCVCRSLESKVAEIESHGIRIPRSISLLGAGSIGLGVAQELAHRGWQVHIYDSNPDVRAQLSDRLTLQHLAVVHDTLHEVLPFGHVCIGASGGTSMTADDYRFLPKNAVLLNIASGNHELSAADMLVLQFLDGSTLGNCTESGSHLEIPVSLLSSPHTAVLDEQDRLWDLFAGEHVCLGVDGNPGQRDRVVHTTDGHSLYFVKSGFVANLHEGPEDPIDLRYFVTLPLLFGALVEVLQITTAGPIETDPAIERLQHEILAAYAAELARTGEDLLTPTF